MLLFFYGDEQFQPTQKVQQLKARFLAKNPTGGGLTDFSCTDECDVQEIMHTISAQNLFAEKKLVIIKDLIKETIADDQKIVKAHLESGTEHDVIVVWETTMPRKNNSFFKWLCSNGDKVHEYSNLEGRDLSQWVQRHILAIDKNVRIDQDACALLIASAGNDLYRLDAECQKLVNYSDGNVITVPHVEKLVHAKVNADIFATIEAATSGDKKKALTLLKEQIIKGDSPHYIFSMYVYHIRTLLIVGGCYFKENMQDKTIIAKRAKLHPFVVQKALWTVQKMSFEQLLKAHKNLLALDQDVKLGRRDIVGALETFVISL